MKIKRYKKVHRTLRFYALHFGFRKPYQLLIDGTLCLTALKNKINLTDQLPKYLDGEVKLLTTKCIVKETEELGLFGASVIVKQFPIHQCGHVNKTVTGSSCLLSMIDSNNSSRYIIATQDRELQDQCRQRAGVPLLYLHITSPTLEAPSPASQTFAESRTEELFGVRPHERKALDLLKDNKNEIEPQRKRKRPKAPNPLSCKKKKGKPGQGGLGLPKKEKSKPRKRKRSYLAKKVKKELMSEGIA